MDLLYQVLILSKLARITIAEQRGIIPLVKGQDVQCYNYSLPYAFARVPEVAIGNFLITQHFMIFMLTLQMIFSFLLSL